MLVFWGGCKEGVAAGGSNQKEVVTLKTSNECSFSGLRVVVVTRERSQLRKRVLCLFSGLDGHSGWWESKGGGWWVLMSGCGQKDVATPKTSG